MEDNKGEKERGLGWFRPGRAVDNARQILSGSAEDGVDEQIAIGVDDERLCFWDCWIWIEVKSSWCVLTKRASGG